MPIKSQYISQYIVSLPLYRDTYRDTYRIARFSPIHTPALHGMWWQHGSQQQQRRGTHYIREFKLLFIYFPSRRNRRSVPGRVRSVFLRDGSDLHDNVCDLSPARCKQSYLLQLSWCKAAFSSDATEERLTLGSLLSILCLWLTVYLLVPLQKWLLCFALHPSHSSYLTVSVLDTPLPLPPPLCDNTTHSSALPPSLPLCVLL